MLIKLLSFTIQLSFHSRVDSRELHSYVYNIVTFLHSNPCFIGVLSDFVLSDELIAKMAGCGYSLADVKFQTTTMD